MLGFELGFWDYVTFAALFILGAAFIVAFGVARYLGVAKAKSSLETGRSL
jgi:hypothetical protein